jgi:hypothetical protein
MALENVQGMFLLMCQLSQLEKGKWPACCDFAAVDKPTWLKERGN